MKITWAFIIAAAIGLIVYSSGDASEDVAKFEQTTSVNDSQNLLFEEPVLTDENSVENPGLDLGAASPESQEPSEIQITDQAETLQKPEEMASTEPYIVPAVSQDDNRFSCSVPKTCPMMRSCDEAMFYFNTCGDTARDRDGDDIPCEKICG